MHYEDIFQYKTYLILHLTRGRTRKGVTFYAFYEYKNTLEIDLSGWYLQHHITTIPKHTPPYPATTTNQLTN